MIKNFKSASVAVKRLPITISVYRHTSNATKESSLAQSYCMNLVKQYDKENFLCTLLLKNPQRRSALAIRAFNVEIARITGTVSDDKIGQMRLKFWEETIDKLFKNDLKHVPEQPVIQELKTVIDSQKLTRRYFQRLITARLNANLRFVTTKQLEEYAENSVCSVLYLLLEAHGIRNVHADHAASHLGKAQGIVNLLRSIPYQERRNVVPVPQEVLMQHGVSQERVLRNRKEDKGVEEVVFQLAGLAHQHLEKSRKLAGSIPKAAKPVLLPGVVTGRYLERLRRANFHLTDSKLLQSDALLPLFIYWNHFRGSSEPLPDQEVVMVLSKYEHVKRIVREKFPPEPGIPAYSGVRGTYMDVKQEIPPSLHFASQKGNIYYQGNKDKFFIYKEEGHLMASCLSCRKDRSQPKLLRHEKEQCGKMKKISGCAITGATATVASEAEGEGELETLEVLTDKTEESVTVDTEINNDEPKEMETHDRALLQFATFISTGISKQKESARIAKEQEEANIKSPQERKRTLVCLKNSCE